MDRLIFKIMLMAISLMVLPSHSQHVNSQIISHSDMMDELFLKDVSSLSEFFKIYNSASGAIKDLSEEEKTRIIASLFDASSDNNRSNIELVRDFVSHVVNSPVRLSFDQSLWCADITVNVLYKNRKATLTLFLKPENMGNEIYRWALCGANQLIKSGIVNDSVICTISPTDNELEFVGLPERLQNDYTNAFGYRCGEIQIDQLSVFLYAVQQKAIKVDSIGEMKYHFMCVPGFSFIVEHCKNMGNSGWLITSVDAVEDANIEFNKLICGDE